MWDRKGFNAEDIKNLSLEVDKKTDRVLGEVYRVRILSTGRRGSQGSKNTWDQQGALKKRRVAPKAVPQPSQPTEEDQQEAEEDEQDKSSKSDSSDDSSSSSSSESDKKKNKKKDKKKAKKAKKAKKKAAKKAKREKAKKQQEEKDKKTRAAAAKKIKAKIDGTLQSLVEAMAQPGVGRIPQFVQDQAKELMLTLQRTTDQASRACATPKAEMPDLQEATKAGADAKKLMAMVNQLVKQMQSLAC